MNREKDGYLQGGLTIQDADGRSYRSGEIDAYGGDHVVLNLGTYGGHEFSRITGRWIGGPVRNFESWRIVDDHMERVQPAIVAEPAKARG